MSEKQRADVALVERGLCESRTKAQVSIMAGEVYVGTRRIDKASELIKPEDELEIRGKSNPYASRGGLKLEKALRENTSINAVNELNATTPFEPLSITSQEEHTRATLKIQEGCNNHCTYCIIPSVRGPIRSRPVDEIRAEAERLAQAGFTELVLTGIHLTSYGRDFTPRQTLLDAIRAVQDVPGVRRIRLGSLEPTVATVEFAQALRTMDKVCPQFHLALQSGSDTGWRAATTCACIGRRWKTCAPSTRWRRSQRMY